MTHATPTERGGRTQFVVLLGVFVALAVAVFWVWRRQPTQPDFERGRSVADQFLELIRSDKAQQAWESTTAEFKSAEGRESFLRYVKEHPLLTKPVSLVSVQTVTIQNSPRAEYVYRAADGQGTVRLLAGNERGTWRIDRITMD